MTTEKSTAPIVEASNVTKHFKARGSVIGKGRGKVVHALDDVSLSLYPGQITALVGESGCGKSTLARCIAQMYALTSGQISYDGAPTKATKGRAFRAYASHVQLMLQDPYGSFNPVATIEQHLTRAVAIHSPELNATQRRAACEDLLAQVHLRPATQFLEKYPHELSGGQLQRCSIARAMAASPAVFLADEPVSALDVSIRLGVLNLLRELTDSRGVALLYVTHDIASARYFAADTAVMYAGQMVEHGPSEAVTQSPAHPYTRLLIDSAPDPARSMDDARVEDMGSPPSLIDPPSGCRFNPRCPFATDQCRKAVPPATTISDGHWARCWLLVDGATSQTTPTTTATTSVTTQE